jgi:hypothetical protein
MTTVESAKELSLGVGIRVARRGGLFPHSTILAYLQSHTPMKLHGLLQ